MSGIYTSLSTSSSILPLIFDTTYLIAYLIIGVTCYAQLRLLQNNLPPVEEITPPPAGEAANPPPLG
jgi:hypothetical protein